MTPERWQRVKEIFEAALELDAEERAAYLDRVCEREEDKSVRREVESLLASHDAAPDFMNEPAVVSSVNDLLEEHVRLAAGERFGRFEVISLIGEGGMGEVYLAEDPQLNRRVALKLLSPGAAASEDADKRFRREARVAAGLDHPHICAVYEVGEADGRNFIAMQYVEGETLDARIKRQPLTLSEALDLASQIADALTEAHARDIVHRDIKPANVMLTPRGTAKVMDFGLAKSAATTGANASGEEATQSFITTPGVIIGTVPYMSPEQVRGEALDARSDIFSFGVMLYEMVAGQRPFAANSAAGLMSAILIEEPPPLARYARGVPDELERIVNKSLRKDREERYQTAKDLLIDLRRLKKQIELRTDSGGEVPPPDDDQRGEVTRHFSARRTAGTGVVVAAPAGRRKRAVLFAALLFLLAASGLGYWFFHDRSVRPPQIDSLAVLPFVNEGGNADVEYLSDGMTDSLINSLSQLPDLGVKARSSVFRYKGKDVSPQQVGADLSVRAVLNGRVVQRGEQLTLYLSLVDARNGNQLWGEQYNRRLTDLVSLQSEMARDVSRRLRARLSGADERKVVKNYTENVEAYQLYLRGRYHGSKLVPLEINRAIIYYRQAIELDPNYALAYAGLADAYRTLALAAEMLPTDMMIKSKTAAQKAIELDDHLSEAHVSLGATTFWYDWDWQAAENQLVEAIELNPNDAQAHSAYAHLLSNTGRHAEALAESKRAREIDPLNLFINSLGGQFLAHAGRPDEALTVLQKTIEAEPNFWMPHSFAAGAYIQKRMYAEAVAEARKAASLSPAQTTPITFGAYALAKSGKRDEARGALQELLKLSSERFVPPAHIALIYHALDDREETFAWLERGLALRDPKMTFLKVDPKWDDQRSDARFQDVLRRMGFPP